MNDKGGNEIITLPLSEDGNTTELTRGKEKAFLDGVDKKSMHYIST
jgi:hypothetical protein